MSAITTWIYPTTTGEVIQFRRVQAGYHVMLVGGIERPVQILRDGSTWLVQAPESGNRRAILEAQFTGHSSLVLAFAMAVRVWETIRTARAFSEFEAAELNKQVVYVEKQGSRAYTLTDVVRYHNGALMITVRPLSGGMEWSYDREAFGTKPFVREEPCGCEHQNHFNGKHHAHLAVPAGSKRAHFVGLVCDECAAVCMHDYLI